MVLAVHARTEAAFGPDAFTRTAPQMPAGKPASQAEESDDPAAAPTAVPAVAGRTPAPVRPPSGTSHFTLHAKKSLEHSLREPTAPILGSARHKATGIPSGVVIRYSFSPQYQRECAAQQP
jgi:hypothetical protein